jgi:hypothetical protein
VCTPCMSCGVCCSRVHLRSLVQLVLGRWIGVAIYIYVRVCGVVVCVCELRI